MVDNLAVIVTARIYIEEYRRSYYDTSSELRDVYGRLGASSQYSGADPTGRERAMTGDWGAPSAPDPVLAPAPAPEEGGQKGS